MFTCVTVIYLIISVTSLPLSSSLSIRYFVLFVFFFFFQAEDGIRDLTVTGVQTCALPISPASNSPIGSTALGDPPEQVGNDANSCMPVAVPWNIGSSSEPAGAVFQLREIGRAACRGRGEISVGAGSFKKKKKRKKRE